eukprot:6849829-Alexandrium_andersonii.AAC.1
MALTRSLALALVAACDVGLCRGKVGFDVRSCDLGKEMSSTRPEATFAPAALATAFAAAMESAVPVPALDEAPHKPAEAAHRLA